MRPLRARNDNIPPKSKDKNNGNGVKKEKKHFVIEFNRRLSTKFHLCHHNNVDIGDPKHLTVLGQSYFNFHEDKIEFELIASNSIAKDIKIRSVSVIYTRQGKTSLSIPIILHERIIRNGQMIMRVHANFKDHLLDLFSLLKRSFKLFVNYSLEEDNYTATFITPIPILDTLDDYNPKKNFTGIFMPEDTPRGKELVRLFRNQFKLKNDFSAAEISLHQDLTEFVDAHPKETSQHEDFVDFLHHMLAIEDLDIMKQMDDYSLRFQKVAPFNECRFSLRQTVERHLKYVMCDKKRNLFQKSVLVIESDKKMPVDVMEFEYVFLTDMYDYQQYHDDLDELKSYRIVAKISYIFDNLILVQIKQTRSRRQRADAPKIGSDRYYHVEFIPNRVSIRVGHRALVDLKKSNMLDYLRTFDAPNVKCRFGDFDDFEWFNDSIEDNEEQQIAIKNIINCTSFPSPYIIFGGPGTGKSSTIVEAIAQIVKLKPNSHILVTASSNSACDDIGNRLMKYVSVNKILRLYSPSFDNKPDKLNANLQQISNFRARSNCDCGKRSCPEIEPIDDPSYEEFYTARVVIVTLVSCGRVVSSAVKPDHFDYIFIDEAAAECEQRTLIPISGLGISLDKINAQIVLCGDHKQLGPTVVNTFARKLGMEISLMERIMVTDEKYELVDGEYDEDYVTQLKKNYRNHPEIMKFSNENFYNNQLISACPEEILTLANDPELLPYNPDFPIVFHTVRNASKEVGTSLKNDTECNLLGYYLNVLVNSGLNGVKISPKDIGIISPYRAQRDMIIENYQATYPELEIGTVDAFQGREKTVIIVSCVRSQTKHIGFLRNEKRLNVALTRAKALLIVIGNAATLQKCEIWNKFITYCYENQAIAGDLLSVNFGATLDAAAAETEEIPEGVEDEYDG